jgi:hypothetical protein
MEQKKHSNEHRKRFNFLKFLKLRKKSDNSYLELEQQNIRLNEYGRRFLRFEIGNYLDEIVDIHMIESGIDFRSYIVPLSFFIFLYFAGFLIIISLINSVFTQNPVTIVIPIPQSDIFVSSFVTNNQINNSSEIPLTITDNQNNLTMTNNQINNSSGIPLAVVQWGFLGGIVYTSIDLLSRFLRKDLTPRVYYNSSFRLIYSAVIAIVIYFSYTYVDTMLPSSFTLLLIVFLAGVAPVQILIHYADSFVSRIYKGWRRGNTVGNKPVIQLEGINSSTAGRLGEEGIDYIQQLALCNPYDISFKTNYPLETVKDWKEQAILYILAGNVTCEIKSKPKSKPSTSENDDNKRHLNIFKSNKDNKITLIDLLKKNMGIRTISSFIEMVESVKEDDAMKKIFKSLEIIDKDETNLFQLQLLFKNICTQGKKLRYNPDKKYKNLPHKESDY